MNQLQTVLDALEQWTDEIPRCDAKIYEAIALVKQMMQAEPVAWRYGIATYLEGDVRGRNWREAFSGQNPNMPWLTKDVTPLFAAPQAVPEGFVLVPVKPTQSMCIAGQDKAREWPKFPLRIAPIYQAMLAAAEIGKGMK